jgi:hypothetical protein
MAIDFPNSPALNDTHTVGSNTWSYDGEKWVLVGEAIDLEDLGDVVLTSPTANQVLTYDGTNWVNDDPGSGGSGDIDGGDANAGPLEAEVTGYIIVTFDGGEL